MAKYQTYIPTRNERSQIGMPIHGSLYLRDFCTFCGEAMRVLETGGNTCLDCKPKDGRAGGGTMSGNTIISSEIDYHGSRFHSSEW